MGRDTISLTSFISVLPGPPVPLRRRSGGYCWFRSSRDLASSLRTLPFAANDVLFCKSIISKAVRGPASSLREEDGSEEDFQVLTAVRSNYNDIVILDSPQSRFLLLDSSHNVHSIFNKGPKWTGSYWDEFASLPAVVPQGPIAIFGLGGGTAAHLMLDLWPSLELEGWEIDGILIDKSREFLGLSYLEKHTPSGGVLRVRVGDALSPSVKVPGGYAGIVIDLFSGGDVLPRLQEVSVWLELYDKLMPNGRLMVNCGAADGRISSTMNPEAEVSLSEATGWVQNSTIKALCEAFPNQINWKKMSEAAGENYLALTGPLPDLTAWSTVLPHRLSSNVKQWRPCLPL